MASPSILQRCRKGNYSDKTAKAFYEYLGKHIQSEMKAFCHVLEDMTAEGVDEDFAVHTLTSFISLNSFAYPIRYVKSYIINTWKAHSQEKGELRFGKKG
jgi:hypothetical protein